MFEDVKFPAFKVHINYFRVIGASRMLVLLGRIAGERDSAGFNL